MIFDKLKNFVRRKSFHVTYADAGSCNGCSIEVLATICPRYDIEQYGIFVHHPNPREADILIITGCVTEQWKTKLKELYDKIPEPKVVVAVGSCACSGGIFDQEGKRVYPPIKNFIPVAAEVPGCPPRPSEILDAILGVAPIVFKDYDKKEANK
ncbi:MAG: NADH-quinone oxidoreductase subunit B family protein [Methanocellales archaeon]|nr:NADH-quinone oxidoreductase subunit B family protein [Methanocellales archaeon]